MVERRWRGGGGGGVGGEEVERRWRDGGGMEEVVVEAGTCGAAVGVNQSTIQ